ncbi:unnamed protein product [Absidia cylindrospora]
MGMDFKLLPNAAWLSGNITSTSGVVRNSTGNYGNPYTGLPKDPKGSPYTWDDPNTSSHGDSTGSGSTRTQTNPNESKIKAGVVAGVISGAVVVLGGGIFLILSRALYRQRRLRRQQQKQLQPQHKQQQQLKQQSFTQEKYQKHNDAISLSDLGDMYMIKPDNRSSYAHAYDDGEQHKPNEHDHATNPT